MAMRWGLVLLMTLSACTKTPSRPKELINFELHEGVLHNGIRVLMLQNPDVPVVSYQSWFGVGSVDEEVGKTGLAHFFEHLMFKGTEKYDGKAFFRELEAKGAEVNAYTTRDYTVFYENMAPSLLPKAIELEADRLVNLTIDKERLEVERRVIFEERKLRVDNSPAGRMNEALWALAFSEHPYRNPIIGIPEDLLRFQVRDLQEFYKKWYTPKNLTIVVAGNFDRKKTLDLIKQTYEFLPAAAVPVRPELKNRPQQSERRITLKDHVASQKFLQGYHIPRGGSDDAYALDVLANIVFEGVTARAHQTLVESKKVALSVSGSAFTPKYPGLFMVRGTMRGNLSTRVGEILLDKIFLELGKNGPTQEEVDKAIKQLTLDLVDTMSTPEGLAQFVGTVNAVLGVASMFKEDIKKYQAIKPEDVKRVAQKYLQPNNRTTVVMGPMGGGA